MSFLSLAATRSQKGSLPHQPVRKESTGRGLLLEKMKPVLVVMVAMIAIIIVALMAMMVTIMKKSISAALGKKDLAVD